MPDQRSSTLLSGLSRAGLGFFKMVKEVIEPPMYLDPSLQVDPSLLQNCKPHHRRAVELAITDMYGTRYEALIRLPASWEKYMCERVLTDKRDLRLFLTFLQVTLWLSLSCAVQLLLLPPHDARSLWWMIPHLVITWVVMGQRFILAMHYAAHRPLFNPRGVLGRNVASALNQFPQARASPTRLLCPCVARRVVCGAAPSPPHHLPPLCALTGGALQLFWYARWLLLCAPHHHAPPGEQRLPIRHLVDDAVPA